MVAKLDEFTLTTYAFGLGQNFLSYMFDSTVYILEQKNRVESKFNLKKFW